MLDSVRFFAENTALSWFENHEANLTQGTLHQQDARGAFAGAVIAGSELKEHYGYKFSNTMRQ